jgi:hypothetical protein
VQKEARAFAAKKHPVRQNWERAFCAYQLAQGEMNKGECIKGALLLLLMPIWYASERRTRESKNYSNSGQVSHLHSRCDNCTSQLNICSARALCEILLTSNCARFSHHERI